MKTKILVIALASLISFGGLAFGHGGGKCSHGGCVARVSCNVCHTDPCACKKEKKKDCGDCKKPSCNTCEKKPMKKRGCNSCASH